MVSGSRFVLDSDLHRKFKGKCKYRDITMQEVLCKLITIFTETSELDKYLNIREDEFDESINN